MVSFQRIFSRRNGPALRLWNNLDGVYSPDISFEGVALSSALADVIASALPVRTEFGNLRVFKFLVALTAARALSRVLRTIYPRLAFRLLCIALMNQCSVHVLLFNLNPTQDREASDVVKCSLDLHPHNHEGVYSSAQTCQSPSDRADGE